MAAAQQLSLHKHEGAVAVQRMFRGRSSRRYVHCLWQGTTMIVGDVVTARASARLAARHYYPARIICDRSCISSAEKGYYDVQFDDRSTARRIPMSRIKQEPVTRRWMVRAHPGAYDTSNHVGLLPPVKSNKAQRWYPGDNCFIAQAMAGGNTHEFDGRIELSTGHLAAPKKTISAKTPFKSLLGRIDFTHEERRRRELEQQQAAFQAGQAAPAPEPKHKVKFEDPALNSADGSALVAAGRLQRRPSHGPGSRGWGELRARVRRAEAEAAEQQRRIDEGETDSEEEDEETGGRRKRVAVPVVDRRGLPPRRDGGQGRRCRRRTYLDETPAARAKWRQTREELDGLQVIVTKYYYCCFINSSLLLLLQ
jgi:hypothetical protein